MLVRHTPAGFRTIARDDAADLQKCVLGTEPDPDWLFRQCQRIADALDRGEIALAQIYGLRIPITDPDQRQCGFAKAGFNPEEPRIPKGEPHAGEWTTGGGEADGSDDEGGGGDERGDAGSSPAGPSVVIAWENIRGDTSETGGQTVSPNTLPIQWEMKPLDVAPRGSAGSERTTSTNAPFGTLGSPDLQPDPTSGPTTADSPDLQLDVSVTAPAPGTSQGPTVHIPGIGDVSIDDLIDLAIVLASRGRKSPLSSRPLRRALEALGLLREKEQAHHIVPKEDTRTDPARKVLERFGIDIHDPVNGVGLPKEQHWGLNSNAYHEWINQALAGAKSRSEAEDILRSIARKLKQGTIP